MRSWAMAALLLALPTSGRSQSVEVTPLVGYRFGGSFGITSDLPGSEGLLGAEVGDAAAFGLQLGFRVSDDGELEAIYARESSELRTDDFFAGQRLFDLTLETWQLGGNYLFGDEDSRFRPYLGVGLGITRLLPEPLGLQDETRFSASFAGGVKAWLGRHVGLRLEARGFFTVLESETKSTCGTNHGCFVHASGTELSQAELRAGLILRF